MSPAFGRRLSVLLALGLASGAMLRAGPPFFTDDPEPVDLHHWESYFFGQGDRSAGTDAIAGPAAEFNYGIAANTQLQSWGPWTTYGGGGVALNSAPGERDYGFAGWLVQRDLGQRLTLGAELFQQGADTADGRGFTLANFGGYLKFTEDFNLLFSGGRSFSGEKHTVWYLGLYWTGGPSEAGKK